MRWPFSKQTIAHMPPPRQILGLACVPWMGPERVLCSGSAACQSAPVHTEWHWGPVLSGWISGDLPVVEVPEAWRLFLYWAWLIGFGDSPACFCTCCAFPSSITLSQSHDPAAAQLSLS
jgi:hypothetical protein